MPRGSSRIFREKVSSAASALGISGGVDFRRASDVFIARARDAYADLGFSVGAAGRSSKEFRDLVELANAELGISPVPAFSQTFSIDFDGVAEDMGGPGTTLVGIADVFSIGGWVNFGNTLGRQDTWFTIEGGAGSDMAMFQRSNVGAPPSFQFFGNGNNIVIPSLPITASTWHHAILTWNTNADVKLYIDGSQFGGPLSGVGTFADVNRLVQIGDASTGVPNALMKAANLAIWTTILAGPEVVTLFNAGSINIDLRVDQGNYASSATLEHFWPIGKDPSPLLGQDLGVGTAIDLEAGAVGITDADRVADVP